MFFELPDWKNIGKPAVPIKDVVVDSSLKNNRKSESLANEIKTSLVKDNIISEKKKSSTTVKLPPPIKPTKVIKASHEAKTKTSKAQQRLSGSRFRFLNQKLYQSTSKDAMKYFKENPEDFVHYHNGFQEQTKAWPQNPLNFFIDLLLEGNEYISSGDLLDIADIGCGEGMLARKLSEGSSPHRVHSFDLVSLHPHITSANMTSLPLPSESVDLAIFSLSLMNVDHSKALQEAFRILRPGGRLWIAEVSSRLGDHTIKSFNEMLKGEGFELQKVIDDNRVFFMVLLHKNAKLKRHARGGGEILQACLYKKR